MAKVTDQYINAEASDGKKYAVKVDVNVDSEGVFSIAVPLDLEEFVYPMLSKKQHERGGAATWNIAITVKHSRSKYRVHCRQMDNGIRFLDAVAHEAISGKETVERLIAYSACMDVFFWEDQNGQPHQDGHGLEGQWWKSKMNDSDFHAGKKPELFAIGIGAVVFDKITTTRKSGDKTIRFERVSNKKNHFDKDSKSEYRLNAFHIGLDPKNTHIHFMPCTDKACDFFYHVMTQICKMAQSLDAFLSDKNRLEKAIENDGGGNLFLAAPKPK